MIKWVAAVVSLAAALVLGGYVLETAEKADLTGGEDSLVTGDGRYYFIAVHCEPHNGLPEQEETIAAEYQVLRQMVARADEYGVKLTLMFTPQWADYVAADPGRMAELESWRREGHEIAAHHHSIHHGNWDGYTDYPPEVYEREARGPGGNAPPYQGTLDGFTETLRKIDPEIDSGCLNEEYDKAVLPDAFVYGSCSGYLNHGAPGERAEKGGDGGNGWNDFVVSGEWNGIERHWLTHFRITTEAMEREAEEAFGARAEDEGGIYGVVTHSKADQAEYFYDFLEFLHRLDPDGGHSLTLTEAITGGMLPEEHVDIVRYGDGRKPPAAGRSPGVAPREDGRPRFPNDRR